MTASARRPNLFGGALWRHGPFLRLWTGQTISEIGSEVTVLAVPLTAINVLQASAPEMGLLRAAGFLPQLLFGVVAGVWVDRLSRRWLLIWTDIGRGLILLAIPLAALLGVLQMWLMYTAMFLVGTLSTIFFIAYQSFLPAVVPRTTLVEGNSKLQTTSGIAQVSGPGLGGILIQLIGAPFALLVDSLSFIVSAAAFVSIRSASEPSAPLARGRFVDEIPAGFRVLYRDPLLRATTATSAILGLFYGVQQAVLILYLINDLRLGPVIVGALLAVGSIGGIVGAILSAPAGRRHLGLTLIAAVGANAVGASLLGLAAGQATLPLLVAGQMLIGLSFPGYYVNLTSLRQALTPPDLLGRTTAAFTTIGWGMIPIGSLLGGLLGNSIGLQATLLLGGLGKLFAVGWLLLSRIPTLREIPARRE